ncbi:ribosome maturation factor RimP [Thioalkalivibrio denitrificans]|uniref:Ribosome maturation factor RimP n=1 Tax=Thioalkalivibrio denitrificans TaxID=108003 RepID=A0A1V3NB11_9GAMM|nr:ribosome maturation factor RimP [Thioalkalivibrio denitrificans]OOG22204.1 ribosome maturation factor RimP [Thioalkalivibrio denitrificans]
MQLKALLAPLVDRMGFELWGLEYRAGKRSALLRLFIDSASGVTLDDCTEVSRQVSAVLDVEDPIRVPYTLEVSSPGIDRPLFESAQYARYVGSEARVRTQWPVEGQRNFAGEILAANEDSVTLRVDGKDVRVPLDAIARGRLVDDITAGGER